MRGVGVSKNAPADVLLPDARPPALPRGTPLACIKRHGEALFPDFQAAEGIWGGSVPCAP